eukprot:4458429-Pyramimonas_sp.AAC.1
MRNTHHDILWIGEIFSIADGSMGEAPSLDSRRHLTLTQRGRRDGSDAWVSATSPSRSSSHHATALRQQ